VASTASMWRSCCQIAIGLWHACTPPCMHAFQVHAYTA
jgi:hypothetical protein